QWKHTMNTDGHHIFHRSTPLFSRNLRDPAAWHTQNPTGLWIYGAMDPFQAYKSVLHDPRL
ncbi:hypothetical protein THAOC_26754, partial [Thalassiosira oceanica]